MIKLFLPILLCWYLLAGEQYAQSSQSVLVGKVTRVIDGDSVIVRQNGRNYEIRLWGIDCPEYNQPFATAARKISKRLIGNKTVRVVIKDTDSYGRLVGVITRDSININEQLVSEGAAWVYGRYCREYVCRKWQKLEAKAKYQGDGLWQDKRAIPPWTWRKRK